MLKSFGGVDTPSVGFASGIERLMEMFETARGAELEEEKPYIYILSNGVLENTISQDLTEKLRDSGFWAERDLMQRSFKAQMKYADKIGAKYLLVIGEDEIKSGIVRIKNLYTRKRKGD